jgi:outer membrane protein assembly factor BamB/WD40 repeat protein/tetratricopeptide (TPR) repeat protein
MGLELGTDQPGTDSDNAGDSDDLSGLTPGGAIRYFGDYELLEEIGRGGMGVVFKARQVSLNRMVALKMIVAGELASPAVIQRFHTEAESAAGLDHPNIVPIYEIGEDQGRHYFTMKFVEGGTLGERMAEFLLPGNERGNADGHPSKWKLQNQKSKIARLMIKVARAVHYAHQRGIIHRDLKPGNILLDGEGEPFVADFGLAKVLEENSDLTHTAGILGTPGYMSPEQAAGKKGPLTTASDIFSLGALLYELSTGRPPFRGGSAMETLRKVIEDEPQHPRALNPALDRDLETICMKCLEKATERRYASAGALADDLEAWVAGKPIQAKAARTTDRLMKWARREPVKAALAMVSCLAVAGLIAVVLGQAAIRVEQEQKKQLQEALDEAGRQRAEADRQRRLAERLVREREEEGEVRTEFNQIDAALHADDQDYALAYLARVAERFPSNSLVAERVLTELGRSQMPRLLFGPIKAEVWAMSPDQKTLATRPSGQRDTLQFWDIETGTIKQILRAGKIITHCAFDPAGDFLAIVDVSSEAGIWDAKTAQPISQPFTLPNFVQSVRLFQGGQKLLAFSSLHSPSWTLWDRNSGQSVLAASGENVDLHLVRVSPDKRSMAFRNNNPLALELLDLQRGSRTPVPSLNFHFSDNLVFEFSPKGDLLAVAVQGAVTIISVLSLEILHREEVEKEIRFLRFNPDGNGILAVTENGSIQFLLKSKEIRFSIPNLGQIHDAQFSQDGLSFVTAGADHKVRLFRSANGQRISQPLGHRQPVKRAWFSHDNLRLFTVTEDSLFRVWDVATLPSFPERNNKAPQQSKLWGNEPVPLPIPDWIPAFLESLSGYKLNPDGFEEFISHSQLQVVRDRYKRVENPDLYERFAVWSITPQNLRPNSPMNPAEPRTVKEMISENSLESLRAALLLEPTNGIALARLAQHLYFDAPSRNKGDEFKVHLQRAIEFSPDEPEVWLIKIDLFRQNLLNQESLEMAIEACARFPNDSRFREAKAAQLKSLGRYSEALVEFQLARKLAGPDGVANPQLEARFQVHRAQLLRAMGREKEAEEAEAKERAATALVPKSGDWPSRGGSDPGRNMYSAAIGLPDGFDPGQLIKGTEQVDLSTTRNVRWAAKLGSQSFGNVVVSGGKVFVGTNNHPPRDPRHKGDRSILMCFDERTGKFLWQLVVPKLKSGFVNDWPDFGLLSSPAVVGDRLYIVTTRGEVLCLDVEGMANGNNGPYRDEAIYVVQDTDLPPIPPGPQDADIIWRYDMMSELAVFPHLASCSSPLVLGDTVFVGTGNGVDWSGMGGVDWSKNIPFRFSPTLVALDRHTGTLLGKDDANIGPRILRGSWSSPSAGVVNGRQLIFFGGPDGWCYAFDRSPERGEDGVGYLKTVWKADCNPPEYKMKNGRPIKYGTHEGISEIIAIPVFYKNRVYVTTGQGENEGLGNLVCLDATQTGDITGTGILWRNQTVARTLSSVSIDPETGLLFIADYSGNVHCLNSETGFIYWTHVMQNHIRQGGTLVADGKVFIGDQDGDFVVLAAAKQKRIISQVNLGAPISANAVVANGTLYVQSYTHLYAVQDLSLWSAVKESK